jgi:hypothetical protein
MLQAEQISYEKQESLANTIAAYLMLTHAYYAIIRDANAQDLLLEIRSSLIHDDVEAHHIASRIAELEHAAPRYSMNWYGIERR